MPLVLATLLALAAPTDSTLLREIEALLRAEPIEQLESHFRPLTVTSATLADLDGDGRAEAIVSIRPTLRQTPTVLIFRRATAGSWERVREGLAPGRLRPVSGMLVDPHVHRVGMDMTAGDGSAESNQRVLNAGASRGMSVVAYKGFLHADMRVGTSVLVDLSAWPLPEGTENTCEAFEFSQAEAVAAGSLAAGGDATYLVALSEDDLTFYRVRSITAEGRLELSSWLVPRPAGTTSVLRGDDGSLQLLQGARRTPLRAP